MSLRITKPGTGERLSFSIPAETADQGLTLGFSTSGVTVERVGNDLVFRFEDGAESRVTNFFVTEGKELPAFILEDGTQVSSADVLKQLNDAIDIETAAGPGAGSRPGSGGAGDYADDAGSLIDGVGRLGAAGPLGQWGYGLGESETVTSAVNLGLTDISATLYPINEDMFAPLNAWDNGGFLRVGLVSASDPEGQPITYSLVPAVQTATMTTDDGSVLTLGTYRIDPVTGELFIDLEDFTAITPPAAASAAQAAAEALANSLRVNADYALSQVNVSMTDGANVSTIVVNPVVTGVNDAPIATTPPAGFEASEHGLEWTGGAEGAANPSIDMKPHFTDADYGEHALLTYGITDVSLVNAGAANALLDTSDQAELAAFISNGLSTGAITIVNGVITIDNTKLSLDSLAVNKDFEVTIEVTATDPNGATATKNVTLTFNGVNDGPEATTAAATLEVSEHGNLWSAGAEVPATDASIDMSAHFTDVDTGDHALLVYTIGTSTINDPSNFLSAADTTALTTYLAGLGFEADGKTIKITDAAMADLDSLAAGKSITVTIPVTATDPSGATATKNVTVTINGVNDGPEKTAAAATLEISEHGNLWASGAEVPATDASIDMSAHFTDVDTGDHALLVYTIGTSTINDPSNFLSAADTTALTTYLAGLGFEADGKTIKITDAAMADLNSLAAGKSITVTIPVTATDPSGAFITKDVTVTINGVNDGPGKTAAAATLEISEHGNLWSAGAEVPATDASIDMSAHFTDVDTGDHALLVYTIGTSTINDPSGFLSAADTTALTTYLAGLGFEADGKTIKITDAAMADLDSLAAGKSITVTIPVTATDPSGAFITKDVTVTINGVNDGPEKTAAAATLEVSEHGNLWSGGAEVPATDASIDMSAHFTDVDTGDHALLNYSIGNGSITHDATGKLDTTDLTALNSYLAGLDFEADGKTIKISDTLMADLNSLAKGASITVTIPVTATDPSGAFITKDVTLTINGVNDAPVDTGKGATLEISEHGYDWVSNAEGTGFVSIDMSDGHFTDIDGDTLTYSLGSATIENDALVQQMLSSTDYTTLQGFLGTLAFEADGKTLKIDSSMPDLDSLASGRSITVTIPVTASDGNGGTVTKNVTLTINGVNDNTRVDNANAVEFHMSETGKEWVAGAEGPNNFEMSSGSLSYDASQHFSDVDTGDAALLAYAIADIKVTAGGSELSAGELAALQANLALLFTIDANGVVTYDPSKLTDLTRLDSGETLQITVTVSATDGKTPVGSIPTKDLEINVHGTETGPQIGGFTASLDEPDTVTWWTGAATSTPSATSATALSAKYTTLDLNFSDADTGDTITVVITAPDNMTTISFTTDSSGVVDTSSFVPGSTLTGDWGQLSYNSGTGKWEYWAMNKADTLNDGTNATDTFKVVATDSSGKSDTQNLAVTINGVDDGVVAYDTPITHGQAAQLLGPYLDPSTRSTELKGTLNLMDVDDNDTTIMFQVKDPATGLYVSGNTVGTLEYEFTLEYGTLTIKWDATASDAQDGLGITGNETGAWVYHYEYTASKGSVQLNDSLTESIEIRAYDPDLYDPSTGAGEYVDMNFDVTVITTEFASGYPRPVYDLLQIDVATGDMTFGLGGAAAPYGPTNNNLLDNDQNIAGADAASYNSGTSSWDVAAGVTVTAQTVTYEYGTLTINTNGTFSFAPNYTHADIVALGARQTMSITVPYTVTEGGKSVTSYLMIQFTGENDSPMAGNFSVAVTDGSGVDDGVYTFNLDLATDVDGDTLSYSFYTSDGAGGWNATPVTGANDATSSFNPADFGLGADQTVVRPDQTVDPGAGGTVYDVEYGWIVIKADGTTEFVVNQNNADVIKLKKGETLEFTVKFDAYDGNDTDSGEIKITITGGFDTLAVKELGDGTLSGTYFTSEVVNSEQTALFSYGATRESTVADDGTGNMVFRDTTGDSLAFNNAAHSGGGAHGQMYFRYNLNLLVEGLDSSSGAQYVFTTNSSSIYGKAADGSFVLLGELHVSNSTSLIFYPNGSDWKDTWALNGTFTEFYTNATGTTEFKLYATSSDDSSATRTEVPLDFAMEFKDDSPVVTGVRVALDGSNEAEGQVLFHDVDTAAADLTLWVENKNGYLEEISRDGISVDVGHGTITMNTDGTFTYERTDCNTNTESIRVVVDDGNSATQGKITIDGDTASTAVVKTDTYTFHFGSNNVLNAAASKNIFTNDENVSGNMLNAGTYILDNLVIKAAGADKTSFDCTRFGSGTTEVSDHFSLEAGSRFEMVLTNCTITFESDGTMQYQLAPQTVKLYDTVSGEYYYFTYTNANAAFTEIAARTGMSVQDVKDALEFTFEYQTTDSNGDLVTGTVEFDWGNSYKNGSQYYNEGIRVEANISSLNMSSAYDGNAADSANPGSLESNKLSSGSAIQIASDLDGDTISMRVATLDAAGNVSWGSWSADTLYAMAVAGSGVEYSGNNIVAKNPSELAVEIPVYAWVKINASGNVSVQTSTPSPLTDWTCVQVGTATWTPSSLGSRSVVGYEADGITPIYGVIPNLVNGTIDMALLESGYSAQLAAFHDYIRNLSEDQRQNLMFFQMQTDDHEGIASSDKILISVTGTDVVLGDNNLPVELSVTEDNALLVDLLSGAKHTVVNSTDSTSRTDSDGWDRFEFTNGGGQVGSAAVDGHTIDGTYGQLVWDEGTSKYTYQVYADSRGDAVRAMTDGQVMTETFNYTVYDKNNESDSGQLEITINGKSDGFTTSVPNTPLLVTEGTQGDVNLGDLINSADNGTMRYCIKYTAPGGAVVETTYDTVNPMETIETQWGRLVFSPTTGAYTFIPNGILQHGDTMTLNFQVMGVLISVAADGSTKTQDTGWISYPVKIEGVNDAPETGDNFFFAASNYETGVLSWTDIDNNVADTGFQFDGWSEGASGDTGSSSNGLETILGDYGTLVLTEETGTYTYTLNANAFDGGGSRVIDEFGITVTDPGDSDGNNTETSLPGTLTVYGVNGEYKAGTTGNDGWTITDGKSHIIHGGQGNDTINLAGSAHENVLVWRDGDASESSPAIDTIIGFAKDTNLADNTDGRANEGDILDLRGLLTEIMNEDSSNTLNDLISFEVSDGNTTINIGSASDPSTPVQQIVLQGTALTANDTSNGTYEELASQIMLITQ
ncbi:MAG: hypothetical protein DELT_01179 [Desulfovibrio sp.]